MPTDAELVALFFKKDETAISEIAAKYGSYCYTIAFNVLGNVEDSEECLNDLWLRLWNTIPPEDPKNLQAYIAKLCRNISLDRYRQLHAEKRKASLAEEALNELDECIAGDTDPEKEFLAKELEESINLFLRKIPKRDASIFIRRYFMFESVTSIAGAFGISENNVSVTLSRLRTRLKKHLVKEGYINE